MYRLSYLSKAKDYFELVTFNQLVEQAARNNRLRNVSGYLAYMQPVFFQYLEGPSDSVLELMKIIQDDPRHTVLTIVDLGDDGKRFFQQPGMLSDYSQQRVNPVLAHFLEQTDTFIHGDSRLRQMTLSMIDAVSEHKSLMEQVINEMPGSSQQRSGAGQVHRVGGVSDE